MHFVNTNAALATSQGKTPIAWDDAWRLYGPALSRDLVLMFWNSASSTEYSMDDAAAAGRSVIAASAEPYYLSNAQDYDVAQDYDYDASLGNK